MTKRSTPVALALACTTCRSRGWVLSTSARSDWPEVCPHCDGLGRIDSLSGLARRLGLPRWLLRRIANARPTRRGIEVIDRIVDVFPQALT